jgi:hypothetical protein
VNDGAAAADRDRAHRPRAAAHAQGVIASRLVAHRTAPMFFPEIIGDNNPRFACYGNAATSPVAR